LRVGEWLVKKFRVPAGNQELVLSAFEEEGWPEVIDDPLPIKPEIVPKQRLNGVIIRLNGSHLVPLLRFHGNGNGEAIGWQLLAQAPLARLPYPAGWERGKGRYSPNASDQDSGSASDSVVEVSIDRNQIGARSKWD
jgi:hypothetical protein